MQEDKEKRLKEMIGKDEGGARRTTIILEKDEREYVDSLIREGKEPGIKPLISKMLDVYRSMMIYDWRFPGEYYCGISRIAFVNVELLNILIQNTPRDSWREIGKKMGEAMRVSIETTLGIQTQEREKWGDVFKRLRVQGFGDFYLKDKYILIKTPFINESDIWAGLLEGFARHRFGRQNHFVAVGLRNKRKPQNERLDIILCKRIVRRELKVKPRCRFMKRCFMRN